jgi:hypothetical protein
MTRLGPACTAIMSIFLSSLLIALGFSGVHGIQIETRPAAVLKGNPAILRSTLALQNVPPTPLCDGTFDFMMNIISFPVAGSTDTIDPTSLEITLSNDAVINPTCITLRPANEADERRAVLAIGDFTPGEGVGPVKASVVKDVFLDLPGGGQVNLNGQYASINSVSVNLCRVSVNLCRQKSPSFVLEKYVTVFWLLVTTIMVT